MDTRTHLLLTADQAEQLSDSLLDAIRSVRDSYSDTVEYVHTIAWQTEGRGPWELVLSIVAKHEEDP